MSGSVYKQLVTDAASWAVYNSVPSQTGDGGETDNLAFSPGETCAFCFQPVSKKWQMQRKKTSLSIVGRKAGGEESAWCDFIFIFRFCNRTSGR